MNWYRQLEHYLVNSALRSARQYRCHSWNDYLRLLDMELDRRFGKRADV